MTNILDHIMADLHNQELNRADGIETYSPDQVRKTIAKHLAEIDYELNVDATFKPLRAKAAAFDNLLQRLASALEVKEDRSLALYLVMDAIKDAKKEVQP